MISRPTSRKNTVINPSDTQPWRSWVSARVPIRIVAAYPRNLGRTRRRCVRPDEGDGGRGQEQDRRGDLRLEERLQRLHDSRGNRRLDRDHVAGRPSEGSGVSSRSVRSVMANPLPTSLPGAPSTSPSYFCCDRPRALVAFTRFGHQHRALRDPQPGPARREQEAPPAAGVAHRAHRARGSASRSS